MNIVACAQATVRRLRTRFTAALRPMPHEPIQHARAGGNPYHC
jgi:hypothetical protein